MSPLPGQRSAQTPVRAAVASSRAIGRAVTAGGGMSSALVVHLRGRAPYRLALEERGETRTCLVTGDKTVECSVRAAKPAPVRKVVDDG